MNVNEQHERIEAMWDLQARIGETRRFAPADHMGPAKGHKQPLTAEEEAARERANAALDARIEAMIDERLDDGGGY